MQYTRVVKSQITEIKFLEFLLNAEATWHKRLITQPIFRVIQSRFNTDMWIYGFFAVSLTFNYEILLACTQQHYQWLPTMSVLRKLVSEQSTLSGSCTKTIVELSSDQENNFPSLVLMLPLTLQTDRRKKCLESARISDAKMCIIRIHPHCKHVTNTSPHSHSIIPLLFPTLPANCPRFFSFSREEPLWR